MTSQGITKAILAAAAGAALMALTAAPAAAFTTFAPSIAPGVASAGVDQVWYDHWGRWHPNRRYWGPHRHCYRGYYGRLHCRWY